MKPCICCGDEKPPGDFYRHSQMADGHLNKCKACCRGQARDRHQQKAQDESWLEAERARGRDKYRRLNYVERYRGSRDAEAPRRWQQRNPEKRAAHVALNNAVRDGRITKSEVCEACGDSGVIHGHHDDYGQPLVVQWLCPSCHMLNHRMIA